MLFDDYITENFWDEQFEPNGVPRPVAAFLTQALGNVSLHQMRLMQEAAANSLRSMGIVFNFYSKDQTRTEKVFPFDVIPRVLAAAEWSLLDAGLRQRVKALNRFIDDIYHGARIVRDGVVPLDIAIGGDSYTPQCQDLEPPGGIWCHIAGMDLVRGGDGIFRVLEDNLRCPSGVSYVLGGRQVMKRTFPYLFAKADIQPVENYPANLLEVLQSVAPAGVRNPTAVVLTPGVFNAAYFEHSFLAQHMGVELVEGRDLLVQGNELFMRTTRGLRPVHVVYRRIDDAFLDPEAFRTDSMLGVSGLMRLYRQGHVTLVNAPGTGVADDKVIYGYVPDMIRYYLAEEPLLPNVPTYMCWEEKQREFVLQNLRELVVKPANASGGYGIVIGPHATDADLTEVAAAIRNDPRNYIAQPVVSLSRSPSLVPEGVEGRHLDLRPFVLSGKDVCHVLPGGLTRVALRKGSLVVNSSQGGGSKDTWVLKH